MMSAEIETRLREKERELLAAMTQTAAEARSMTGSNPQNGADLAESKETVFQETTSEWHLHTQVRAALERLKDGTYGKCADCGRTIENSRLESIPWAAYCLIHQEPRDRPAGA
jgi:RNA polymerase-binding transcription factor DksA